MDPDTQLIELFQDRIFLGENFFLLFFECRDSGFDPVKLTEEPIGPWGLLVGPCPGDREYQS